VPGRRCSRVSRRFGDVTNRAANRICHRDRRGVDWKRFEDADFVDRDYQPFDAAE